MGIFVPSIAIPADIASDVADVADEFVAAENIIMDYVKAPGEKNLDEYRLRMAEFGEAIARLKDRVGKI